MSVVFLVLPLALLIAAAAVAAYLWAARTGQFDDLETPRHRALWEEDAVAGDETGKAPEDAARDA